MTPEEKEVLENNLEKLRFYLILTEPNGQAIVEDLEHCFEYHRDELVNEELSEIPHPFRAYAIMGQQMVVRRIKEAIELAKNPPELPAEENDNEPIE